MGKQVDEILDRYVSGTFDAMTDCAGVVRSAWTDAFGDARFVSGVRENSDKGDRPAIRTVVAKYGECPAVATVEGYRKAFWNVFPGGGGGAPTARLADRPRLQRHHGP